MSVQSLQQPKYELPIGISALPLSQFPTGQIMVGCDCCGRSIIPVRGLLRKYSGRSVGEVVEEFRCAKCGQPPVTASLLSQTRLI
jgi:hypothetical protein